MFGRTKPWFTLCPSLATAFQRPVPIPVTSRNFCNSRQGKGVQHGKASCRLARQSIGIFGTSQVGGRGSRLGHAMCSSTVREQARDASSSSRRCRAGVPKCALAWLTGSFALLLLVGCGAFLAPDAGKGRSIGPEKAAIGEKQGWLADHRSSITPIQEIVR
jgi:hypothetical protein